MALLASCAPFQFAGGKAGNEWAFQSGGVWSKTHGVVQKAQNGKIKLEQVYEDQDGVAGPQGVFDMKTTLGLAGLLKEERVNANNNKTAVDLKGTKDPNFIPDDPEHVPEIPLDPNKE